MRLVIIFYIAAFAAASASISIRYLRESLYKYMKIQPLFIIFILLIILSIKSGGSLFTYLITAGLIFGMFGDFFLLDDSRYIIPGMISFVSAHLCYIAAFVLSPDFNFTIGIPGIVIITVSLIYIYTLNMLIRKDSKSKLFIPAVAYCVVLTVLNLAAQSYDYSHGGLSILSAGTFLFYISDAFLSWDFMINRYKSAALLTMSTYYSAQMLIAYKAVQIIFAAPVL